MAEPVLRFHEDALSWKEIEGEIVALDLARGTYFSVNSSGVSLFRALVDGSTRSQLVSMLSTEHQLSTADAERDVDAFLVSCREKGFLPAA